MKTEITKKEKKLIIKKFILEEAGKIVISPLNNNILNKCYTQ